MRQGIVGNNRPFLPDLCIEFGKSRMEDLRHISWPQRAGILTHSHIRQEIAQEPLHTRGPIGDMTHIGFRLSIKLAI